MAELRYAHVYFKNRSAGILKEEPGGGTVFNYNEGFAQSIACSLQYTRGTIAWPSGVHPFFQHLTPEGWLRNRQARTAEIGTEDDLGILLVYGYDCIGAVSIHAPDGWKHDLDLSTLDAKTRAAVSVKKTISGVQPKLFADEKDGLFFPAEETGQALWIAKFPSDTVEDMVLNEDLSLKATGILLGTREVTVFKRGTLQGVPDQALLVKRFDRLDDGEKLRLEDFAQILNIPKRNDFSGKYSSSFEEAGNVIKRHSAAPILDLYKFFARIVAFALLGNCDCHLKNWSLLETARGLRLSPVYDVLNTYIYAAQGYSTKFGLNIEGREWPWEAIDRKLLTNLGQNFGIEKEAIDKVFEDFSLKQSKVLSLIEPDNSTHLKSSEFRIRYADTVRNAYARITK